MSEAEGVKAAVEAVKALSASINIPQKLHEINVKEEDIPALAVAAFNDVCTGGNPRPTSVADIEACIIKHSKSRHNKVCFYINIRRYLKVCSGCFFIPLRVVF